MEITPIARISTPFGSKFGVPRQAGLASTPGHIVFEPTYREAEAVRGLEGFDYLWLVWGFHLVESTGWSPTVRPPRLGGNRRMGVFATRSPFRPNGLGLSSVRLVRLELGGSEGPVIHVEGADMVDGTPIYDIKPYVAYADSHPEARSGFAQDAPAAQLRVECAEALLGRLPAELRQPLADALAQDPRPHYQQSSDRVYSMQYADWEVRFRVAGDCLTVVDLKPWR